MLKVGDALDNWIFPVIGHLYSDPEALKESAEKIRLLGERKLYYGHGRPTWNEFKNYETGKKYEDSEYRRQEQKISHCP